MAGNNEMVQKEGSAEKGSIRASKQPLNTADQGSQTSQN